MTHYDINYKFIEDEHERIEKAIADIKEYAHPRQWSALMRTAEDPSNNCDLIALCLSLMGVSGYPVHAFLKRHRAESYQRWYDNLPEA